ncbi:metal-dependent protein hydrolase [Chaetomium sp. MPI-SDFR-AT-0129]|uniref:Metal-dependent protein hydrolase n=1 Tax=Dichotomopilus funicola TaxID=1934379 RepID=A0AAN6V039_9PEZI|nr:metal-dependent protein hydrolase [Chaetomium sp. MPI-SDFR-AT-0129]KAK4142054.1 metal-dependent protein hydrolase [Dichotomopilus funicola]
MAENAAKRLKTDNGAAVAIGTHNGHFHADEALAVYMLRTHIPTYAGARLVRTRDANLLETCHTVVDVGGEYEPARNRFDHHQRTFSTTFPDRPTKLSSAGLVYLHFGKAIIARRMAQAEDSETVSLVWRKIYENFVEALDAHDNGISSYDPALLAAAGAEKRFSNGAFTLGAMVGRFNGYWNDPVIEDPVAAQAAEDQRFELASQRIGEEFDRGLDFFTRAWLPAREVVAEAFNERQEYDSEGRILVLKKQSAPWKDHLYTLEEEKGEEGKVLYVLYPEKPVPGAKWRIQCVPSAGDSFESRKPLPEAWRGSRDEELDGITGVEGGVFVHASGFIGGNKTFEGALAMAKKALKI